MSACLRLIAVVSVLALATAVHAQDRPDSSGSGAAASRSGVAGVDLALLREAIAAAERGDVGGATSRGERLGDPVARKLVEWFLLRSGAQGLTSARYMQFLSTSAAQWPGDGTLRMRAEVALLTENRPAGDVVAFFRSQAPRTGFGKVALARALASQGNTERAHALVRDAWRSNDVPASLERIVRERFPGVVTRADEKARMDRLFYKERASDGMAIATRLGGAELAIGRARAAVVNQARNAQALLDAVPADARNDPGYMFSRIQWLRRNDRHREAAQLLLAATRDQRLLVDPDEWWTERRLVSRKLLEDGDARTAYRVASGHSARSDIERMDAEFTAGWIALRFLNDAGTASRHFATLAQVAERPISVARAAYWRGRAAEAGGGFNAREFYEQAARHRTTYYGQLAMAKLGRNQISVAPSPGNDGARARFERREGIRAIRLLHAAGLMDKARPFFVDLADQLDGEEVALLGRLGGELGEVRYMLLAGKQGLQRGLPVDHYAYPVNGVPNVPAIGPQVERALVLALSRQESTFDPRIRSSAGAVGLMQLLPSTAQQTARRYNLGWQPSRITEPGYNTQLGTAYLGEAIQDYRGSYILAFAAYNAGRGRVREWLQRFGDPRDPNVDPIDWVERIPFSETRNYVMRVMENLQVYRARLAGSSAALRIEQDLRRNDGARTTSASAD